MSRSRDDAALRPIGLALTAVVAGLGAPHAAAEPLAAQAKVRAYAPEPSRESQEPEFVLGEAMEPFAETTTAVSQPDLFEL